MNHDFGRDQRHVPQAWRSGFTLVELLAVMTIIGIILVFILIASQDARRRAEERATQSLITKLETALNDRVDALLQTRPDYNNAHYYMSAIWYSSGSFVAGNQRAQTIAWYDYVKAELPDVWFVQNTNPGNTDYPINFAAYPYPGTAMSGTSTAVTAVSHYILPLGNNINPPTVTSGSYGDGGVTYPNLFPSGSGIYGASYGAAAGLYKNLGFSPNGYDGVDNNGNGLIDEFGEGGNSTVTGNLANHKHVTARSEMLYALLVEGRGPLGSSFKPDDFTEREVQDTDGDGLPEFIDAWGQPLQFFRWPVFYHSDIQRGQVTITSANISQYTTAYTNGTPALTAPNVGDFAPPYLTVFEQREINPLDQNSQLVAPSWWSTGGKTSTLGTSGIAANSNSPFSGAVVPSGVSGSVSLFEALFHPLTEPYNALGSHTSALPYYWDRGGNYPARRSFYSKFLVLSGGPDQLPGVFLYNDTTLGGFKTADLAAAALIANENNAMQFGLDAVDFTSGTSIGISNVGTTSSNDPLNPNTFDIQQAGQDDIGNHNLQATGGIGGSG
jgi:prepilin-type N-terminal cleavage/methylation domain-containing protein